MAQTIPFPTPADVKAEPLGPVYQAAFAAIPDARVQRYIDSAAEAFGSAEVLRHTQRNEAVLYGACHLLTLRLIAEMVIVDPGGGGGLNGALSAVKLDGVGSKSFAVQAWAVDDLNDWLKQKSPFSTALHMILDTFPPGMFVIGASEGFAEMQELAPYFFGQSF